MDGEREREQSGAAKGASRVQTSCADPEAGGAAAATFSLSLSLFISIPFAIKYLPQNVPAHVRLAFREVVGDRVDRHMIGHKINAILPLAPLLDLVESREINPE